MELVDVDGLTVPFELLWPSHEKCVCAKLLLLVDDVADDANLWNATTCRVIRWTSTDGTTRSINYNHGINPQSPQNVYLLLFQLNMILTKDSLNILTSHHTVNPSRFWLYHYSTYISHQNGTSKNQLKETWVAAQMM